ncbi:hypothetical protein GP486_001500 [Trichoglossum hirsutum]|uniref:Alpha/beta hydrolase fold-3 domain-containing protein n=1 Tax=Trichoglossum hirsutum TaxID=265104 RepID=A0A9P8LGS2_9PEZI|nr:hypothetical protein GP486_001500 [Trichoglossum hirsutum]
MELSVGLVRALIPKFPLILKTTVSHSLSLSDTASQWDLGTALTVSVLRSFVANYQRGTVTREQTITTRDPGVKGPMWVSKVTLPAPEDSNILEILFKAIHGLCDGRETFTRPELSAVEAEWVGHRPGVDANTLDPDLSPEEKYNHLMDEVKSDLTVLYIHGEYGSLLDPASHRGTTHELAKMTKGRCFVIRYRLAPTYPFPAGLLDALIAYLSLLYPPPGSIHAAVTASKICFSGDSAGGGMSLAIIQVILELRRQSHDGHARVHWCGEERELPLPAGAAINSGWFDLTRSMESIQTNARYDYLPAYREPPSSHYTPDLIWPTSPPRCNFYANDDALLHPLISPVTARDWRGAPPLWFVAGEECLFDEIAFVAQQLVNQDIPLVFEYYRAMPHCFALVLPGRPSTRKCFYNWTNFLTAAITDPGSIKTNAVEITAKTLEETPLDPRTLSPRTIGEVRTRMKAAMDNVLEGHGEWLTSKL